VDEVELLLVTPEEQPLQLFEGAGSDAVRRLLAERRIAVLTGSSPVDYADGELRLAGGDSVEVDEVVTVPRLEGPFLDWLPATDDGFIPIDAHGRVAGLADVYAAGDSTDFPVKQAVSPPTRRHRRRGDCRQAGADVVPRPFRPVLRALLLTGEQPLYLAPEAAGNARAATVPIGSLLRPQAKIRGRYLSPFLTRLEGVPSGR
jgi:sulfide:quinone oxidoreductase